MSVPMSSTRVRRWSCVSASNQPTSLSNYATSRSNYALNLKTSGFDHGDSTASRTGASNKVDDAALRLEAENSAIALVAGTTVGAGVLALPSVSYEVGFFPSLGGLVIAWLVMVSSSLSIAEVSANLAKQDAEKFEGKSFLTLIQGVFGQQGYYLATFVYISLHYALLVAYDSGAADVIARATGLPENTSVALFAATMGLVCGFGTESFVSLVNNSFFALVLAAFAGLLVIGIPAITPSHLIETFRPALLGSALPVMVLSFVHHNIVPTVSQSLQYDKERIVRTVLAGSGIPLVMFLLWNAVVLGIGPVNSIDNVDAFTDRSSFDSVAILSSVGGAEKGGIVASELAEVFSGAAIITSFIGFFIGLTAFFEDAFGASTEKEKEEEGGLDAVDLGIIAAVTIPPAVFAIAYPSIFVSTLDLAGTYGISILFLLVPSVMSLLLRERSDNYESFQPLSGDMETLLPVVSIACALGLIVQKAFFTL